MDVPVRSWAVTAPATVGMPLPDLVGHVRKLHAPALRQSVQMPGPLSAVVAPGPFLVATVAGRATSCRDRWGLLTTPWLEPVVSSAP